MINYTYCYGFWGFVIDNQINPILNSKFNEFFGNLIDVDRSLSISQQGILSGFFRPLNENRIIQYQELDIIYQWFQSNNIKCTISQIIK